MLHTTVQIHSLLTTSLSTSLGPRIVDPLRLIQSFVIAHQEVGHPLSAHLENTPDTLDTADRRHSADRENRLVDAVAHRFGNAADRHLARAADRRFAGAACRHLGDTADRFLVGAVARRPVDVVDHRLGDVVDHRLGDAGARRLAGAADRPLVGAVARHLGDTVARRPARHAQIPLNASLPRLLDVII